jgi:hypothetical protein
MKSPNVFPVSVLTPAISIHPHSPDSSGIFPSPKHKHTLSLPLMNHQHIQVHREGRESDTVTTGSRVQATAKLAAKGIFKKLIVFLYSTNFKLLTQIGGNSINNCVFYSVHNF